MPGRPSAAALGMAFALALLPLGAEISPNLPPGSYAHPIRLFFSSDDPKAFISYRFEGARNPRPLESALFLDALPGEERGYILHVEARSAQGKAETASFQYKIDRRPPAVPVPGQAPGQVAPGTAIELSSPGSARILYSLAPAQAEVAEYSGPVRIPDYRDGIVRYSLSAVAIDDLGNASLPFSGDYVSTPKGYAPAADLSRSTDQAGSLKADAEKARAIVEETESGYAVRLSHPRAIAFRYQAADSAQTGGDPSSLLSVEAPYGETVIGVAAPQGWIGTVYLNAAAQTRAGSFASIPKPIALAFVEKDVPPSQESVDAKLLPASRSRGAWFLADSSRADIRYQVEGQEPRDYSGPVFIQAAPGKDALRLSYSASFRNGTRSKDGRLELSLPADPGRPELDGMPPLRVSASSIILSPGAGAKVLRYELKAKEGLPPAVGPSSPIFEPNTVFQAKEGETVAYRLRLRSFSSKEADAVGGDEAFLDFAVDRTPPDSPKIREQTGMAGAPDKFIGFDSGTDEVYFRIARDGASLGAYQRFTEPVRLEADADGPVSYSIYSYAVDAAGNRSGESRMENIGIDATSVYLSGYGSDLNDGSPSSPLLSLEAALRVATITGRYRIKVSGSPKPAGDLVIEGDMRIEGGYGPDWIRDDSAQASLSIRSIFQKGGRLSIEGLDISGANAKGLSFLSLRESSASLYRSTLRIESKNEEAIELSKGAVLDATDCMIGVRAKGRVTAILSDSSRLRLLRTTLSLEGADVGTAISASGGAVSLEGASVSCDSVQSAASLALTGTALEATRSLIDAKAAKGFAACLFARDSTVKADTSLFRSARSAETVFFDLSGGTARLSSVTAFADGSPRAAYAFRLTGGGLELRNSAFAVMNPKADGALFDGNPDPKSLQSVCSAGFKRLVKGREPDALAGRVLLADPASLFEIDAKGLPRLTPSSPLVDAGTVPEGVGASDWYGNPRPSKHGKGLPDIGALEYQ